MSFNDCLDSKDHCNPVDNSCNNVCDDICGEVVDNCCPCKPDVTPGITEELDPVYLADKPKILTVDNTVGSTGITVTSDNVSGETTIESSDHQQVMDNKSNIDNLINDVSALTTSQGVINNNIVNLQNSKENKLVAGANILIDRSTPSSPVISAIDTSGVDDHTTSVSNIVSGSDIDLRVHTVANPTGFSTILSNVVNEDLTSLKNDVNDLKNNSLIIKEKVLNYDGTNYIWVDGSLSDRFYNIATGVDNSTQLIGDVTHNDISGFKPDTTNPYIDCYIHINDTIDSSYKLYQKLDLYSVNGTLITTLPNLNKGEYFKFFNLKPTIGTLNSEFQTRVVTSIENGYYEIYKDNFNETPLSAIYPIKVDNNTKTISMDTTWSPSLSGRLSNVSSHIWQLLYNVNEGINGTMIVYRYYNSAWYNTDIYKPIYLSDVVFTSYVDLKINNNEFGLYLESTQTNFNNTNDSTNFLQEGYILHFYTKINDILLPISYSASNYDVIRSGEELSINYGNEGDIKFKDITFILTNQREFHLVCYDVNRYGLPGMEYINVNGQNVRYRIYARIDDNSNTVSSNNLTSDNLKTTLPVKFDKTTKTINLNMNDVNEVILPNGFYSNMNQVSGGISFNVTNHNGTRINETGGVIDLSTSTLGYQNIVSSDAPLGTDTRGFLSLDCMYGMILANHSNPYLANKQMMLDLDSGLWNKEFITNATVGDMQNELLVNIDEGIRMVNNELPGHYNMLFDGNGSFQVGKQVGDTNLSGMNFSHMDYKTLNIVEVDKQTNLAVNHIDLQGNNSTLIVSSDSLRFNNSNVNSFIDVLNDTETSITMTDNSCTTKIKPCVTTINNFTNSLSITADNIKRNSDFYLTDSNVKSSDSSVAILKDGTGNIDLRVTGGGGSGATYTGITPIKVDNTSMQIGINEITYGENILTDFTTPDKMAVFGHINDSSTNVENSTIINGPIITVRDTVNNSPVVALVGNDDVTNAIQHDGVNIHNNITGEDCTLKSDSLMISNNVSNSKLTPNVISTVSNTNSVTLNSDTGDFGAIKGGIYNGTYNNYIYSGGYNPTNVINNSGAFTRIGQGNIFLQSTNTYPNNTINITNNGITSVNNITSTSSKTYQLNTQGLYSQSTSNANQILLDNTGLSVNNLSSNGSSISYPNVKYGDKGIVYNYSNTPQNTSIDMGNSNLGYIDFKSSVGTSNYSQKYYTQPSTTSGNTNFGLSWANANSTYTIVRKGDGARLFCRINVSVATSIAANSRYNITIPSNVTAIIKDVLNTSSLVEISGTGLVNLPNGVVVPYVNVGSTPLASLTFPTALSLTTLSSFYIQYDF